MGRTKKGQRGYVFARKGHTNGVHPRTEQKTSMQKYTTNIVTTEEVESQNSLPTCLWPYTSINRIRSHRANMQ